METGSSIRSTTNPSRRWTSGAIASRPARAGARDGSPQAQWLRDPATTYVSFPVCTAPTLFPPELIPHFAATNFGRIGQRGGVVCHESYLLAQLDGESAYE
jgi:hypothetical protein